jgi:dCMP deaminase
MMADEDNCLWYSAVNRRPTMQEVYMKFAMEIANRSTCKERQVGCVVTSKDFENVYSVGYNGTYAGGANECDNITNKGGCGCVHSEVNALIKCSVKDKQKVIFITLSPCQDCAKLIINSGASKVYYAQDWKNNPGVELLKKANIECIKLEVK